MRSNPHLRARPASAPASPAAGSTAPRTPGRAARRRSAPARRSGRRAARAAPAARPRRAHDPLLGAWAARARWCSELVPEFEREQPGRARRACSRSRGPPRTRSCSPRFVGGATPDVAQLGNTWIAEFVALGALEPLDAALAASPRSSPRRLLPRHLGDQRDRRRDLRRALVRRHPACSSTARDLLAAAGLRRSRRATWADVAALRWSRAAGAAATATPSCCRPTSGRSR